MYYVYRQKCVELQRDMKSCFFCSILCFFLCDDTQCYTHGEYFKDFIHIHANLRGNIIVNIRIYGKYSVIFNIGISREIQNSYAVSHYMLT